MGLVAAGLGGLAGEAIGKKYGGSSGAAAGKLIGSGLGTLFPYFKKGGIVKKTGPAVVHKGELIVPRKYVADVPKTLKAKIRKDNSMSKKSKK